MIYPLIYSLSKYLLMPAVGQILLLALGVPAPCLPGAHVGRTPEWREQTVNKFTYSISDGDQYEEEKQKKTAG